METNKEKFQSDAIAPMHTAEHILNQTMVRMFGCKRSMNTHIERKKSKCDYWLESEPSNEQINEVERKINEVICQNLPVTEKMMPLNKAANLVDMSKLPEDVGETIRIVSVGDYDHCACIGQHVTNTSEIGVFKFLTYDFEDGRLRIRYKLER